MLQRATSHRKLQGLLAFFPSFLFLHLGVLCRKSGGILYRKFAILLKRTQRKSTGRDEMKSLKLTNRGVQFASIPGDLRLLAMCQGAMLKTPARTLHLVHKSYCLCSFRASLVKTCSSAPRQCPEFRKITFFTLVGLGVFR